MEEPRKKQRTEEATASENDSDVGDDIVAWLSMDEEAVGELMKFLDEDAEAAAKSSGVRVKFIENPYLSPLIFQSSSSYITINGNEESCGSSFSDNESSVMASVDVSGMVSGAWGRAARGEGEWWGDDCVARFLGEDDLT